MADPASGISFAAFSPLNMGGWEVILLLVFVLIIFGPKRLPALSRAIGKSIRDFKKGLQDVKDDIERAGDEEEAKEAAEKEQAEPLAKSGEETDKSESTDKPAGA